MNSASSLPPQVEPGVATVVSPQFFEHPWDLLISRKDVFIRLGTRLVAIQLIVSMGMIPIY